MMKKLDAGTSGALATIVPTAATFCVVTGLLLRKMWQKSNAPPTFNMGFPVLGSIIQFLKDPLELIRRGQEKCGEIFKVNMIAKEFIFLVGKDGHEFFFTMDKYLDQAKMYSFTIPIFGKKVLYDTDYSTRMSQLHFIRERLTDNCLASYVETLESEVVQFFDEEWIGKNGNEGVIDVRSSFIELLSRTSIRCLMGNELRSKMHSVAAGNHTICEMLHILEQGMLPLSVFMPSAPIPRHRARDAARKEMQDFLLPILAARRKKLDSKEGQEEGDFLWKVLKSKYPDGRPITDEEIVGFLIAAFFGGMHNSSITTSWSTLEIFSRPKLVTELKEEQDSVLGGPNAPFTFEGYLKMKKLRSAVMETLRLHPPLMLLMRTVEQDVKFKKFTIPKGSVVGVSPNVAHLLPGSFAEPKEYQALRFVDGVPSEFDYIPFGGGRRLCKGQEFGFLQIICAISHMLRRYDMETLDGVTAPTIGEGMVIAPSQPCRVKYVKRE